MNDIEKQQTAYEKWAKPHFSPECFRKSKDTGRYYDLGVQFGWQTWQAALSETRSREEWVSTQTESRRGELSI